VKADETSRLERMRIDRIEPDVPPNPLPYLTGWLFEIGPTASSGMGPTVIGWQDIAAWQGLTGIEVDPWEARALRRLSADFLNMTHEAKDASCPPPFASQAAVGRNRDAVGRQITMGFAALRQAKSRSKVGGG